MNIIVDVREKDFIECITHLLNNNDKYKDIELSIQTLQLGDIIIKDAEEEKIMIERKSLVDLSSSIKDGRYEEQSYRLNGLDMPNHNIIYLIEGDLNKINMFKHRIDKNMLYSAMFSLNYIKGFSVLRTFDINESALVVCQMAYKIKKCKEENKIAYYTTKTKTNPTFKDDAEEVDDKVDADEEETDADTNTSVLEKEQEKEKEKEKNKEKDNYCSVVKKVKKENITPENIGEIILCQIPSISSINAVAIMAKFKTIPQLIQQLQQDEHCLHNITYMNSKNQIRKINKTIIANIIKYLKI